MNNQVSYQPDNKHIRGEILPYLVALELEIEAHHGAGPSTTLTVVNETCIYVCLPTKYSCIKV